MKKVFLIIVVVILATVNVIAQQIAVVTGSATQVCQTLTEAIECAQEGSIVYLPGGGFTIHDSVKINKRLTIVGISHKANSDNADGYSRILGNLFFNEGSSNSALMGCYVTGTVHIGQDGAAVKNITIRYCNLGAINVSNNQCNSLVVNQNYIRDHSYFGYTNAVITNNVMSTILEVDGGTIECNILLGEHGKSFGGALCIRDANHCSIMRNILGTYRPYENWTACSGCQIDGNMRKKVSNYGDFGDNCINISEEDWANLFTKNSGINPASNFHFTENFKQYEDKVGIYAGTSFSDGALPPVPYISEKKIAEQTDAAGKLEIFIKVKASDGTIQGGATGGSEQDQPVSAGDEEGM